MGVFENASSFGDQITWLFILKPKSEPNEAMERQIIDIFGSWIDFGDIGAVSEEETKVFHFCVQHLQKLVFGKTQRQGFVRINWEWIESWVEL